MRLIAVTLVAVSLAAVSAVAVQASPTRAQTPTRIEKLSPTEQKWAAPLIKLWNDVNKNLHLVIGEMTAKNALFTGSPNNKVLTVTLGIFASCKGIEKNAGKLPSTRIAAFATAMTNMCSHLYTGATDVAKSIGAIAKGNSKLATTLITTGTVEFKKATTFLGQAQRQLMVIGGKAVFTA